MNKKIKKKWVKALRSGDYKPYRNGALHVGDRFCCLGVLCDLAAKEGIGEWKRPRKKRLSFIFKSKDGSRHDGFLPQDVKEWAGLNSTDPWVTGMFNTYLSSLNDSDKLSFKKIADLIEEHM